MNALLSNPALALAVGVLAIVVMLVWQRVERAERLDRLHGRRRKR